MTRVLVLAQDSVASKMAGPGIRSWELAAQLSAKHQVTLAVPNASDLQSSTFQVVGQQQVSRLVAANDVCLTQIVDPRLALTARRHRTKLIADFYDPILLETLENDRLLAPGVRRARNRRQLAKMRLALTAADAVICATERQRDLWLGCLMALDRLTPARYDVDPTLNNTLGVVPFGLPAAPPVRSGPGPREIFGLNAADVLLLWGGGVWDWLDPLTVLRAVSELRARDPRLRLVFMGMARPGSAGVSSDMIARVRSLAHELGEVGEGVFFNDDWVAYEERPNFLLDADAGVSAHFDHLETRYAFRTRVLDYLWAGLPVLCTRGDETSREIERAGAGVAVPAEDVNAMRFACAALLEADRRDAMSAAARRLGERYRWEAVAQPLLRIVDALQDTTAGPGAGSMDMANWMWQSGRLAMARLGTRGR